MHKHPHIHFIIVAAGEGTRFSSDIPKQFCSLEGRAVISYSIDAIRRFCQSKELGLSLYTVLSESGEKFWPECNQPGIIKVKGGNSRANSVSNALDIIKQKQDYATDVVMIHDAARPLISQRLIAKLFDAVVAGCHAVVPATKPTDSLMIRSQERWQPVNRNNYVAVQTPQAFNAGTIIECYLKCNASLSEMTDDASVYYHATGRNVDIVAGEAENIKITNPGDLEIAAVLLAHVQS